MKAAIVVGLQFGDEGKGKVVDGLTARHNFGATIRYNGGANAGHTIVNEGKIYKLHLVPSGIFKNDTLAIIGTGTVIDPLKLVEEVKSLESLGISLKGLKISQRAHLVTPWHMLLDRWRDATLGIGTTGRGIGPCYETKAARVGVQAIDLKVSQKRSLKDNLERLYEFLASLLGLSKENVPTVKEVLEAFEKASVVLGGCIEDTDALARHLVRNSKRPILLEGAQGTLIDLNYGSYPYVSSSSACAAGACEGSGLPPNAIGDIYGVAKAYTTRVGNGEFLTEDKSEAGDRLRILGGEFGTTTGRPRRCGWFDLPLVSEACALNGVTGLIITKLDVLSKFSRIPIVVKRALDGKQRARIFRGWQTDIDDVKEWNALPENAQKYLQFIEEQLQVPIIGVGTGADRAAMIWKDNK